MNVPTCPIHSKPMKQNQRGWYCPTKVGVDDNGQAVWCKASFKPNSQTTKPAETYTTTPPNDTTPIQSIVKPIMGMRRDDQIKAALEFAGRVFGDSGNAGAAMELATKAIELFEGEQ